MAKKQWIETTQVSIRIRSDQTIVLETPTPAFDLIVYDLKLNQSKSYLTYQNKQIAFSPSEYSGFIKAVVPILEDEVNLVIDRMKENCTIEQWKTNEACKTADSISFSIQRNEQSSDQTRTVSRAVFHNGTPRPVLYTEITVPNDAEIEWLYVDYENRMDNVFHAQDWNKSDYMTEQTAAYRTYRVPFEKNDLVSFYVHDDSSYMMGKNITIGDDYNLSSHVFAVRNALNQELDILYGGSDIDSADFDTIHYLSNGKWVTQLTYPVYNQPVSAKVYHDQLTLFESDQTYVTSDLVQAKTMNVNLSLTANQAGINELLIDTMPSNTVAFRLHFSRLNLQDPFESANVYDVNHKRATFVTGMQNNVWTEWISGNQSTIRMISDQVGSGFEIDRIEYIDSPLDTIWDVVFTEKETGQVLGQTKQTFSAFESDDYYSFATKVSGYQTELKETISGYADIDRYRVHAFSDSVIEIRINSSESLVLNTYDSDIRKSTDGEWNVYTMRANKGMNYDFSLRKSNQTTTLVPYVIRIGLSYLIDQEAPSAPTGAKATDLDYAQETLRLVWNPSTDNQSVWFYRVYVDSYKSNLIDSTLSNETTIQIPSDVLEEQGRILFNVRVVAVDSSLNESEVSNAVYFTKQSALLSCRCFDKEHVQPISYWIEDTFKTNGLYDSIRAGVEAFNEANVNLGFQEVMNKEEARLTIVSSDRSNDVDFMLSPSIIAYQTGQCSSNEALIKFNLDHPYAFDYSKSVTIHEVGHALGLHHQPIAATENDPSEQSTSVMTYTYYFDAIQPLDLENLIYLYGTRS